MSFQIGFRSFCRNTRTYSSIIGKPLKESYIHKICHPTIRAQAPLSLDLAKCRGSTIATTDGNQLIDFAGHVASQAYGYNEPRITEIRREIGERYPFFDSINVAHPIVYNELLAKTLKLFKETCVPNGFRISHAITTGSLGIHNAIYCMQAHRILQNYEEKVNNLVTEDVLQVVCNISNKEMTGKQLLQQLKEIGIVTPMNNVSNAIYDIRGFLSGYFPEEAPKPGERSFLDHLTLCLDLHSKTSGYGIIGISGCFHGREGTSRNLMSTDESKNRFSQRENRFHLLPSAAVQPNLSDREIKKLESTAIDALVNILDKNRNKLAGLIFEPIQGEGGDLHFRKKFIQELFRVAKTHDLLICADEVQTGMGATGKMWAYEHYGVEPDLIVTGKKSFVSFILSNEKCYEHKEHPFNHPQRIGSTWAGGLNDYANLFASLTLMNERNALNEYRKKGKYLEKKLTQLEKKHPKVLHFSRGEGLIRAISLQNTKKRNQFVDLCRNEGVFVMGSGSTSVRFRPPYTITKSEIDEGIEAMDRAANKMNK